jgi:Flp pilus assembly pilin Flp
MGGAEMNHVLAKLHLRLYELKRVEQGQDMLEYVMLGSIIALVVISTFPPFAAIVTSVFVSVSSSLG